MVADGQQLTTKQKAVADAIISDPTMTQRAAAKLAGVHEQSVSAALSNSKVTRYIEQKTEKQRDTAGALITKTLAKGHKLAGVTLADPLDEAELTLKLTAIGAKVIETIGEGEVSVPGAVERAEYRRNMARRQLLAAKACARWPGAIEAYRARANPNR